MVKQDRSFGSYTDAELDKGVSEVTLKGQAYVDGILSTFPECALIAKHYPGYNEYKNSDVSVVVSEESKENVLKRGRPFLDVKGVAGIMMASIRYKAFGGEPAVWSKELIDSIRAEVICSFCPSLVHICSAFRFF